MRNTKQKKKKKNEKANTKKYTLLMTDMTTQKATIYKYINLASLPSSAHSMAYFSMTLRRSECSLSLTVYLSRKHCRCVQMLMESEGAEGRKVGRNV
jgi:hypothetical protein